MVATRRESAMKVLWFTNTLMPDISERLGRSPEVVGGWMPSLLAAMRRIPSVELAVGTMVPRQQTGVYEVNGVTYVCLPTAKKRWSTRGARGLFAEWREVIASVRPDVIHVHGTEDVYARFTTLGGYECPSVVSIQGLIHEYARHVTGGVSLDDAARAGAAGILSWLRYHALARQWRSRGVFEREALRASRHFIGRTAWDEAHVRAVNPAAVYHQCHEVLRPAFFRRGWQLGECRRHSIFCTAAHSPHKGFHVLLESVKLLRGSFPDVQVRVAGAPWSESKGRGCYGRYIKSLIDSYDLGDNVVALPALDAEGVARELTSAHAFVIPSLIENSPNSLAEAMLVGTPCVAALVGGVPSMIDDGTTALGFPPGDAAYVAQCLRRLFTDDGLAQKLSGEARRVAEVRHDPTRVVTEQVSIYEQVIADDQAGGRTSVEGARETGRRGDPR